MQRHTVPLFLGAVRQNILDEILYSISEGQNALVKLAFPYWSHAISISGILVLVRLAGILEVIAARYRDKTCGSPVFIAFSITLEAY